MPLFTMSAANRIAVCPASAALPGVDTSNPDSQAGTITHRFLERVPQVGRDAALAEAPEDHRERLACIELDGLPLGPGYRQEVAFSLDVAADTARRLGSGLDRDYSKAKDTEIPGTADVEGPTEIHDYKTDHGHDELAPPPADNLQIRGLALAKSRTDGLEDVTGTIIRIRDDGANRMEEVRFNFLDLEATLSEFRRIVAEVREAKAIVARGEEPKVRQSVHCRYCPAKWACPAFTKVIRAMVLNPSDLKQEVLGQLTPESAHSALTTVETLKTLLGEAIGALKAYAKERPIDLGNGKVWGPVEKSRDEVNGKIAREVLASLYGDEVANSVKSKTTKKAIEEALRLVKEAQGTPLAELKREAFKAISMNGGIESKPRTEFEVYEKASNE